MQCGCGEPFVRVVLITREEGRATANDDAVSVGHETAAAACVVVLTSAARVFRSTVILRC